MTDPVQTVQNQPENSLQPEWAKPPSLLQLKQYLEDARTIHGRQVKKIDGYLDNLHIRGSAVKKFPAGNSQIQPKLIRKQAEWRYPALSEPFLSTSDIYNVNPVSWEDKESAVQNELVLNNQFNTKLDKVDFIDEYVRTGVEEGTIIVKVGWCFEQEDYEEEQPIVAFQYDQTYGPVIQQLDLMKATAADQYEASVPDEVKAAHQASIENQAPMRPFVTGSQTVKKQRTVANHPTLEICDYRNVIIDPTAKGKIKNANFVIYSFETSLAELQKDGRYKDLDKINVQNNTPLAQPDHEVEESTQDFNLNDKPRSKIVVYEYWGTWDIDGSGSVKQIVAAWVGDVLIRMEENPYPDKKIPFVVVPYLPVRRQNYGEPDGALLEDNQAIIGALMRGMVDVMAKSANGQTGMRKDMLDSVNRRRYEKGLDYEFNPNVDPRVGVHMHTYPEIPQSATLMLQLQQQEAESMTGVKSFAQGISGNSLGDVAAGVRGVLDASSKRETGILRRLAQGMIEIGRKIIAMNQQFLSEEEVVRITNEKFVTVRRDDLAGNFDLRLSISTAEEDDSKARDLGFVLQTMGPNSDPGLGQIILADICRLRKMPDLAHRIENFQPQPDPVQQKMQELQIAKIEAEIAEVQAKTASLYASAGLHQQKAGTEVVKQGHIKSDTDLKNLEFVEQESGVHQERELQKQDRIAANQAVIEKVKADSKPKTES